MLIPIELLRKNDTLFPATDKQVAGIKTKISEEDGPTLDGPAKAALRKQMIQDTAPDPVDAYERYIGNNDLLPINYLSIGTQKSMSVGRLRYTDLTSNSLAMATGFLITPDLILTNHHVFQGKDLFKDALIDFDYAYDAAGQELPKISFVINPDKFFYTFKDLDFTLVGIETKDQTGAHAIQERGYLVLNPMVGKAGIGDSATIIQYPDGNYEQIGLRENQILDMSDPNSIIYKTDTSPGTSGSPVFNDQWQVIALHSSGVAKKNRAGDYIDKTGQVIPVVNGKVDSTQVVWTSNSGIRISALMKQIFSAAEITNDPKIQFLKSPGYSDSSKLSSSSSPKGFESVTIPELSTATNTNKNYSAMEPCINIPNNTGTVNIYLDSTKTGSSSLRMQQGRVALDDDADESKKLAAAQDFSDCKGFQTKGFLSLETPIPSLSKDLARQAVPLTANPKSNLLQYYYYSSIQHAIRKMPLVSMINVEGNVGDRKDSTKRVDNWLQDNRIDSEVQLSDAYYLKSGFDKGHMCRREDADYGSNAAAALLAANTTCMYTNACPQVPKLNRAPGLWGSLEKIILEQGVKKEDGVESKISVYNGPIFVDSDPVYLSVQVPLRFFKIVVWLNGKNEKKTTAFVLSQEDLVSGIQFEELDFNKEFITHQCSVAYIEKLTNLTFDMIHDWDTYVAPKKGQAVNSVEAKDVTAHMKKNK